LTTGRRKRLDEGGGRVWGKRSFVVAREYHMEVEMANSTQERVPKKQVSKRHERKKKR